MTLDDLIAHSSTVTTREDFAKFVHMMTLVHKNRPREWRNATLGQFLEGLSMFTADLQKLFDEAQDPYDLEAITWAMAANMILVAITYRSELTE